MLEFNKGKLTIKKDDVKTYDIDSVEFDGVVYKLPQVLHFAENATEIGVYKEIVKTLSKKYLKTVKA